MEPRNGAIAPSRLITPDVVDFITATRLSYRSRDVDIDDEMWAFATQDTKDALIYGINQETSVQQNQTRPKYRGAYLWQLP